MWITQYSRNTSRIDYLERILRKTYEKMYRMCRMIHTQLTVIKYEEKRVRQKRDEKMNKFRESTSSVNISGDKTNILYVYIHTQYTDR